MSALQMQLRQRVMDPRRRDDISDVLAEVAKLPADAQGRRVAPAYMVNYYPPGLREVTLGPHSKKLTGVTRFYPTLSPQVVVDFEPAPPDKWYFEEKTKFFSERKVLYIGIDLRAQLTSEQFADLYRQAKIAMERTASEVYENAALDAVAMVDPALRLGEGGVEEVLLSPEFVAAIDRLALARAGAMRDRSGRPFTGVVYQRNIRNHKQQIVEQCRGQLRHGMDPSECYRQLADPAA